MLIDKHSDIPNHLSLKGGMLLAIAYVISGKLGLMLALPPGFASPIFPAAGIAVAATLIYRSSAWLWIFLGSLLLNMWVGYEVNQQINALGATIALIIAFASMCQAAFAQWLLQRNLSLSLALDHGQDILRFLLLSPVACLVSASLSILGLWSLGIVESQGLLSNWAAWWIGDLLGVMLFVPITLSILNRTQPLWRSRIRTVSLPMLLILSVFIAIYLKTNHWEHDDSLADFQQHSQQMTTQLHAKLQEQELLLQQTAALFVLRGEQSISRADFSRFHQKILQALPIIQAVEWAPYVAHENRAKFEAQQAADIAGFAILEKASTGKLNVATARKFYYPVTYVEPLTGNLPALGFDLYSNEARQVAIQNAIRTGKLITSAPIRLIQEQTNQAGILLIMAIEPSNPQSGVVLSVLRVGDFMYKLLPDIQQLIHIRLRDLDAEKVMYDTFVTAKQKSLYEHRFTLGSRHYVLETAPTEAYFKQHRGWQSWAVLTAGLVCTGLLGALLLLGTGYTARIKAQVILRTKELEDSKTQTAAILNNVLDGIITFDQQGIIQGFNESAEKIFAYSAAEVLGQSIQLLLAEPYKFEYQCYLGSNNINNILGNIREIVGVRKDQQNFPMDFALSKMELGEQVLFNGIVRDITERNKVERLKSEFISTVSHELRTPLTSIRGSLSLMNSGIIGSIPDAMKSMLDVALRNSERLILLVNDILDMEKIKAGKMEFNFKIVKLIPLLEQAVTSNQAYAAQYKVSYILADDLPDVALRVDENRLLQVLANLLSNAAKFSPANATVEIRAECSEQRVRIVVTDHGIGISDEFKSRIFQPFSQADSSDTRKKGGTGLGLSITKAIVEQMGGHLDFVSEANVATSFYVEFPQYQLS